MAAEVCQLAWLRLTDHRSDVAEGEVGRRLCAVAGSEARGVAGMWRQTGLSNVILLPAAVEVTTPSQAAARRKSPRPVA